MANTKKCNVCGVYVDDEVKVCPTCGAAAEAKAEVTAPCEVPKGNGNVIAGAIGALLFGALGGVVYFVIYQLGVVAGISGLAIFLLAGVGYRLFSGTKNKASAAGLVCAVVSTIVWIYLSEHACVFYELYVAFAERGLTLSDTISAYPEFLAIVDISDAIASDLTFAYIFGLLAAGSEIVKIRKEKKKQKR